MNCRSSRSVVRSAFSSFRGESSCQPRPAWNHGSCRTGIQTPANRLSRRRIGQPGFELPAAYTWRTKRGAGTASTRRTALMLPLRPGWRPRIARVPAATHVACSLDASAERVRSPSCARSASNRSETSVGLTSAQPVCMNEKVVGSGARRLSTNCSHSSSGTTWPRARRLLQLGGRASSLVHRCRVRIPQRLDGLRPGARLAHRRPICGGSSEEDGEDDVMPQRRVSCRRPAYVPVASPGCRSLREPAPTHGQFAHTRPVTHTHTHTHRVRARPTREEERFNRLCGATRYPTAPLPRERKDPEQNRSLCCAHSRVAVSCGCGSLSTHNLCGLPGGARGGP
eukprot:2971223-Prymnesium_polylepis.1